jgi:hypothetical protein
MLRFGDVPPAKPPQVAPAIDAVSYASMALTQRGAYTDLQRPNNAEQIEANAAQRGTTLAEVTLPPQAVVAARGAGQQFPTTPES